MRCYRNLSIFRQKGLWVRVAKEFRVLGMLADEGMFVQGCGSFCVFNIGQREFGSELIYLVYGVKSYLKVRLGWVVFGGRIEMVFRLFGGEVGLLGGVVVLGLGI